MKKALLFLVLLCLWPSYAEASTKRIVSGEIAPAGSWSAQAIVRPAGTYLCGGTLVASRWVLTAAHCLDDPQIRASNTTVTLGAKSQAAQGSAVERIFVHRGFSKETYLNDIALLRLKRGSYIPPARIAGTKDRPYWDGGQTGYIAGWGTTCFQACSTATLLRQAEVPIRSKEECAGIYGIYWYQSMICAGEGRTDACQGDSGGPLQVQGDFGRILIGIVSWGIECANANYPGVYTDVSYHLPWLGSRIVSRVRAPGYVSMKGSATFQVSSSDPLRLPTSVRPVVTGSAKRAFRISANSCGRLEAGGNCKIKVQSLSFRFRTATIELRNRAGVVMNRVRVAGLR